MVTVVLTALVAIAGGMTAWAVAIGCARLKGNLLLRLVLALSASGMIWLLCGWRFRPRRFPERTPGLIFVPDAGFTTRLEKSTAAFQGFLHLACSILLPTEVLDRF